MIDCVQFGDCRETMKQWIEKGLNVQMCVTSPPYYGLRDYGVRGQMGQEDTPQKYIEMMVEVFGLVRTMLSDDGVLWLNMGDSYATGTTKERPARKQTDHGYWNNSAINKRINGREFGCKPKDLLGVPWMLAFALRADGWYLRQDVIWSKPNPMPELVTDRCTRAHEYLFMFSKSRRYYYDAKAIRTQPKDASLVRWAQNVEQQQGSDRVPGKTNGTMKAVGGPHRSDKQRGHTRRHDGFNARWDAMSREEQMALGANKRSVWEVATRPYRGAHFATFPPALIEPCILSGSRSGDTVLDPFMGSGTTAQVALQHGRHYLGCELNPAYKELIDKRLESMEAAA